MKGSLKNKEKDCVVEKNRKISLEEKMDRFNDKHSWSKFSEKQIKTRVKIYKPLLIVLGILLILLSPFAFFLTAPVGIGFIVYALKLEKIIAKDIELNKNAMAKYEDENYNIDK